MSTKTITTPKHSCTTCHGNGRVVCPECGGKKKFECSDCHGKGHHDKCSNCGSTGKVRCTTCGGSGKVPVDCPVCNWGKVPKTRLINCDRCHGTGIDSWTDRFRTCPKCGGSGQIKDYYDDICPNCHGDYEGFRGKETCSACSGTGKVTCSYCNGTGKRKCASCDGSGKISCKTCGGVGSVKCPECRAREKKAEEQRRKEQEKQRQEAYKKEQEAYKKEQAEQRAKKRRKSIQGCGCLLVSIAIVVLLVWVWFEGYSLNEVWELIRNSTGGSAVVKVGGGLIALFLLWKLLNTKTKTAAKSDRKRWLFVLIGLISGVIGLHFLYARRKGWFVFYWLMIVSNTAQTRLPIVKEFLAGFSPTLATTPIFLLTAAAILIGSIFFMKKDGAGNRM